MNSPPHIRCTIKPRACQSGTRYICELCVGVLLVCITLHTFLLAGLIVPVTVSGGSMAETILGPRREVVCPHCGITFACGHERMPASGRAICLNCGFNNVFLSDGFDWTGEHALIDRATLAFRAPRRWEVLVFRCPEQADTYCIKRIVGLPGEEIQIRAGDVYVNGQIARKSLTQCRAVAQLVHDAAFDPGYISDDSLAPGWRTAQLGSHWNRSAANGYVHSIAPSTRIRTETREPSDWLEFHPSRNVPITDDDSYNQSESRRLNRVSDVMLTCELSCVGSGELVLRSEIEGDRFELRIDPTQRRAIFGRNGKDLEQIALAEGAFARATRLEFVRFDRQILLAIGGRQVLQQEFEPLSAAAKPDEPASEDPHPPWALGATSLDVEVGHLRLLRDIYYTVPTTTQNAWGVRQPVLLSDDEFFVLGDNSPISADSRIQDKPGVERKSLIGRLLTTW